MSQEKKMKLSKAINKRGRRHCKANGGLLHCWNRYTVRWHNPRYDEIDWGKTEIRMIETACPWILAGYDMTKNALKIQVKRHLFTFYDSNPRFFQTIIKHDNPEEYFYRVIRREHHGYMRELRG